MTNIEYIRQLPGCEDFTFEGIICTKDVGLDEDCCGDCEECEKEKATIGGKPAPYLFACPVKPGQTVYRLYRVCDRDDVVIEQRVCCRVGFTIYGMVIECDYWFVFHEDDWLVSVFPTREAAEKRLEDIKKEG